MRISRIWIVTVAGALLLFGASASRAQPKPARRAHAAKAPGAPSAGSKAGSKTAKTASGEKPRASSRGGKGHSPKGGAKSSGDAGVVKARVVDGGTHEFSFGGVEIEGRLKSPELVYFLRRVRAEFRTRDLGHRSFFPELSESRKASAF